MEIDWFTVIAQVINFLVLVWLLKRFLYQPVLAAIADRESKIAAQLNDAAAKQAEALRERQLYQYKNDAFEQQRKDRLATLNNEVKAERQKQMEAVRNESQQLDEKLKQSILDQQEQLNMHLRQGVRRAVFDIAGKALASLGSADMEEQIIRVFIDRIIKMDEKGLEAFRGSFGAGAEPVVVSSAFPVPSTLRKKLQDAVAKLLGVPAAIQYVTKEDSPCGVQLSVKNYSMQWNLDAYLNDLKQFVDGSIAGRLNK